MDLRECKAFPLNTGFPYGQVPFEEVYTITYWGIFMTL